MRLFLLTCLTMIAFAANSVLTRAAIDGGHMNPAGFAFLRTLAGGLVLYALVAFRKGQLPLLRMTRLPGAVSLAVYMIGFSLAYVSLDAGLGALLLFGVVQIVLFLHSAATTERPTARQIGGAALAFGGLTLALWPEDGSQTAPIGAALMVIAGIGWAAYTIVGRRATDPLAATAANFILCLPCVAVPLLWTGVQLTPTGLVLAAISGGATSGLGYALWYHVLPQIRQTTAAVVQLIVPVLAIVAGAVLLGENLTSQVLTATALVVGGIGWAVTQKRS